MNETGQEAVTARERMAAAVFYGFSFLLSPVTLAGYVLWGSPPI